VQEKHEVAEDFKGSLTKFAYLYAQTRGAELRLRKRGQQDNETDFD